MQGAGMGVLGVWGAPGEPAAVCPLLALPALSPAPSNLLLPSPSAASSEAWGSFSPVLRAPELSPGTSTPIPLASQPLAACFDPQPCSQGAPSGAICPRGRRGTGRGQGWLQRKGQRELPAGLTPSLCLQFFILVSLVFLTQLLGAALFLVHWKKVLALPLALRLARAAWPRAQPWPRSAGAARGAPG